jgi:hypothetical protein
MDNDELNNVFSKLNMKLDEYTRTKKLIGLIKSDDHIQNDNKILILKHINNIFFYDNDINEKGTGLKKEIHDRNNEKTEKHVKESCKKCDKQKFKKYDYCYKHCQEENIIPKDIKRKDYNNYIKTNK